MASPATLLPSEEGRPPLPVGPGLWLFAPSRESQGGSAWLLASEEGDLLIDCPGYTRANLRFLAGRTCRPGAGRPWIVLTGRDGHGRCRRLQQALSWPVLVQEQEAYLLPGVESLHTFAAEHRLGGRGAVAVDTGALSRGLRGARGPGGSGRPGRAVLRPVAGSGGAGPGGAPASAGHLPLGAPAAQPGAPAPLAAGRLSRLDRQRCRLAPCGERSWWSRAPSSWPPWIWRR